MSVINKPICILCSTDSDECDIDCDRKATEMALDSESDDILSIEDSMEFLFGDDD